MILNMNDKEKRIYDEIKIDPEYANFSEEELLKVVKEIIEDGETILQVIDNRSGLDVYTQFEACLILYGRPDLLGIMTFLYFYNQIDYFHFKKQTDLARTLGMSEPTFKVKRDELQKLGLVDITKVGRKTIWKLNRVERVMLFNLPPNLDEQEDYIKKFKKTLNVYSDDFERQQEKIEKEAQSKIRIAEKVKEEVQKEKEKAKAKAKRDEVRFPAEDYSLVLNAYTKYKGIGLVGTEVIRAKHAIKQMFLATRSVKNIVDCMKFFHDHQKDEEYSWMRTWTLETIMKKIPEFVAGKLKAHSMDDDYEEA